MKQYPSIGRDIHYGIQAYVFDKLDGSNVRAEWSRKNGFYKFGSKTRLVGTDQLFLPETEELVRAYWEGRLSDIFRKERYESAVCFFEFWGEHSFAGVHVEEPHKVSLIDVSPYKKGILEPKEYMDLFGELDIAQLLYRGNVNHPLVEDVKTNRIGCTGEGVVCKSAPLKKGYPPLMFKIKTDSWIDRLKAYCKGDEKLFEKLL